MEFSPAYAHGTSAPLLLELLVLSLSCIQLLFWQKSQVEKQILVDEISESTAMPSV